MNSNSSDQANEIRDAVQKVCERFDDDYWGEKDTTGTFPEEFVAAITEGGWLGIAMPTEYGGAGRSAGNDGCLYAKAHLSSTGRAVVCRRIAAKHSCDAGRKCQQTGAELVAR